MSLKDSEIKNFQDGSTSVKDGDIKNTSDYPVDPITADLNVPDTLEQSFGKQFSKIPYVKRKKMLADKRNLYAPTQGVMIRQDETNLYLAIDKKFLKNLQPRDIAAYVSIAASGFFTNSFSDISKYKVNNRDGCAIFMKNVVHYSGGRYCALLWAHIMASLMKVTIFTNMKPPFIKDFEHMPFKENIQWAVDGRLGMHLKKNDFKFTLGIPNDVGQAAITYSEKWNIPCYMTIFESPNFVREYRRGIDSEEKFWVEYKKCMKKADGIIGISNISGSKAKEWIEADGVKCPPVEIIYPPLNQPIADMVVDKDIHEANEICYISRMTGYKNPLLMIKDICKLRQPPDVINLIGRAAGGTVNEINKMNKQYKGRVKIKIYEAVSDIEKFIILKRSKLIVFPSTFEGFGMSPMEGFYMSKPVIAYDLPVLREVYGNHINYVPVNDSKKLAKEVEKLLEDKKERERLGEAGRAHVIRWCLYDMCRDRIKEVFPISKKLSLSVGTIVLNGAEWIKLGLKTIYPKAKEIIIVEGAVEDYAKNNPDMVKDGCHSIDNTVEIIKNFPDPENKIKFFACNGSPWQNKQEMQNKIAENITGDIFLKQDSDECYLHKDVDRIVNEFESDPDLFIFRYKFNHFWHSFKQIAIGGQWESKMVRCWRWRDDFRYQGRSFNVMVDKEGKSVDRPNYKVKEVDDRLVFHMSYVSKKPEMIRAKLNYYKNRGIETNVKDTYTGWKRGNPTQPTAGGGTVKAFAGEMPKLLTRIADEY